MPDSSRATPPRSWVCSASLISGIVLGVGVFALSAPGATIEGIVDVAFGVAMSCWVGLPLILLGVIKVFRSYPNMHLSMWSLGCFVLFGACWQVFFAPRGSTAALGLLFVPFYLLAGYGVAAMVLLWHRNHSR